MQAYQKIRDYSLQLCAGLETEDHSVQPQPFVSPPKWHLGHTTWFFETFCLRRFFKMDLFDERFPFVFNSYYESQGAHVPQERRGILSRPTLKEVLAYRAHVDRRMQEAGSTIQGRSDETEWRRTVTLGLQHEQQHQELLMMDIKSILFNQPGYPAYDSKDPTQEKESVPEGWRTVLGGVYPIGATGEDFAYDNEGERHEVLLREFQVRNRLVTNAEYLDFITDGGYRDPQLWLSDGWRWVQQNKIEHPMYWVPFTDVAWQEYTLRGLHPLNMKAPVAHISYFEADAFARWKGLRLPTEFEWEVAFASEPRASLWQWTQSAYLPYPGFKPFPGGFAEYNGKFMSGQMVLRGGCAHTPTDHYRPTYRNFFYPEMRWPYSGIRLAQ